MTGRIANRRAWALILGVLLAPSIPTRSLGSPYYQITPLDGYDRGVLHATNLNNVGQVAGFFSTPEGDHEHGWTYSFFYDSRPGGGTTVAGITLPSGDNPGGYDFGSKVTGLNDKGQAVARVTNGSRAAILDARTGQATSVDLPQTIWPNVIDNQGRIYGVYEDPGIHASRPFIYESGKTQLLDLPPGVDGVDGIVGNSAGQALVSAFAGSTSQAFLYSNGAWTKLGDFRPRLFNERGDVIGHTSSHELFLAHGTTTPIDLGSNGPPAGWSPSDGAPYTFTILGMNNKGELVGQSAGDGHGFLYRDGVTTDLNSLIDASGGWVIKYALSINDLGQILATTDRGYVLLTPDGLPTPPDMVLPDLPPVPEPSTYLVFGTLAVGFLWRRSRA